MNFHEAINITVLLYYWVQPIKNRYNINGKICVYRDQLTIIWTANEQNKGVGSELTYYIVLLSIATYVWSRDLDLEEKNIPPRENWDENDNNRANENLTEGT